LTFRHFLLLLEIDYQKFLSLEVVLKIRSDHDIATTIASDAGHQLSNEDLLPIIKAANGSFRNLFHNVGRLARRKGDNYGV
jgi:hypothetical protein